MDETPMSFSLPSQTTIEECRKRTISVLTTGHERTSFTVTLACLADGTKLPPFIIFKLINVLREQFPDSIYVRANSRSNPRSLLVLDSFTAYRTDSVKYHFCERNTDIAVILSGLTSHLQPLDVSLNKTFKAKVTVVYSEDNLIFDFEKVLDVKGIQISVEEEKENSESFSEDIESDPENEYYENEERNYINIWE
ncbi:4129_t:CDS:2, partial [Scutellospora calospora]